jgi:integrase/recombinase XerD
MAQLRDRMEQDLKLRGVSPATIRNYLLYCRKFAAFFMRSPEELGASEVRAFLLHQIERRARSDRSPSASACKRQARRLQSQPLLVTPVNQTWRPRRTASRRAKQSSPRNPRRK